MSLMYPTRRGGSSATLVVTFLLGILIGAVLFYAVADSMGWNFSAPLRQAQQAPEPTPATQQPSQAPAPTPPPAPAPEPKAAEPPAPTPPPAPAPKPDVPDGDIAKHFMVDVQGTTLDDATKEALAALKPGLVVLRSQNLQDKAQGQKLIADIKAAVGGDGLDGWPLIAVSQEGGEDNPLKLKDAPSAKDIGDIQDFNKASELARKTGIAFGAEARAWGIGIVLAPRLDVFDPKVSDPSIEARSFGPDSQDTSDLANSMQLGLHEAGVIAVGKHFPGLGQAVKGDDGALTIPLREIRYLVETLLPFSDAAANGMPGLLAAEVSVPGLEQAHPELPAPLSMTMIQKVLRTQLKFEGVVIADDISSSPLTSSKPVGEVVAAALATGCDVIYVGSLDKDRMVDALAGVKEALAAGTVTPDALASGLARLERWREFLKMPPLASAPKPKAELPPQPEGTEKLLHRVARGETIEAIAKKYGVEVADLMTWNGLTDKKLAFAQRLNVYVLKEKPKAPEEKATPDAAKDAEKPADAPVETKKGEDAKPEEKKPEEPKPEEKKADEPKPEEVKPDEPKPDEKKAEESKADDKNAADAPADAAPSDAKPADKPSEPPAETKEDAPKDDDKKKEDAAAGAEEPPVQYHLIVAGDTLRKIAGMYNTTPAELIKLNKLTSPDQILLGTKLKVPKP